MPWTWKLPSSSLTRTAIRLAMVWPATLTGCISTGANGSEKTGFFMDQLLFSSMSACLGKEGPADVPDQIKPLLCPYRRGAVLTASGLAQGQFAGAGYRGRYTRGPGE